MSQLSDEMRDAIHNGAGPIRLHDRRTYYERVASELRKAPMLTNACVMDAIRTAQREMLRPPVGA